MKYTFEIMKEYEDAFKGISVYSVSEDKKLMVDFVAIEELEDAQKEIDEAYQRGLDDAWEAAKKIFGYEIDGGIPIDKIGRVFGYSENETFCTADIIRHNTASEAIAKLKAYEAEQGHSDTIDESYTIGYKQANNNSKSNTECDGCLYDYGIKEHSLCHTCSNAYINHWTAKKQDDKIEVGDEVEWDNDFTGDRFIVTRIYQPYGKKEQCDGIDDDGCVYHDVLMDDLEKTGRHFDIEKILEEMKK